MLTPIQPTNPAACASSGGRVDRAGRAHAEEAITVLGGILGLSPVGLAEGLAEEDQAGPVDAVCADSEERPDGEQEPGERQAPSADRYGGDRHETPSY